jgi:glutamate carboxypeptidase
MTGKRILRGAALTLLLAAFIGSAPASTARNDKVYQAVEANRAGDALASRARSIYAELGKTIELSGNGGASESALAMAEGTPALDGLGFVGGDFHTDHEWIDLNSITPRLYLFTRLLMEMGSKPP